MKVSYVFTDTDEVVVGDFIIPRKGETVLREGIKYKVFDIIYDLDEGMVGVYLER